MVRTQVGLLHQLTFKARLEGEAIETEKAVVLAELRDGNTIDTRVAQCFYRQMFNETILPRRFPIGNEQSLIRFTAVSFTPGNSHAAKEVAL